MRDATFDQLRAAGAVIAGSPETVRDGIAQFAAEYGIGNLYAQLSFGSLPRDLAMRNVSLFAEQVAPALRGLWAEHDHHWWPRRLGGAP
jgi:alkanesulfonate monooxygenase SsuD/methylene tetrahydromethanopterin reductase-like flavin-dependent oxidoreductase (luciferase family)